MHLYYIYAPVLYIAVAKEFVAWNSKLKCQTVATSQDSVCPGIDKTIYESLCGPTIQLPNYPTIQDPTASPCWLHGSYVSTALHDMLMQATDSKDNKQGNENNKTKRGGKKNKQNKNVKQLHALWHKYTIKGCKGRGAGDANDGTMRRRDTTCGWAKTRH